MTKNKSGIAVKTAALVENHSLLASLLAVLCLMFAVNYFLVGPGSDGGSGLGGTGKFGGESGLGGTGKGPDSGPGFKLGAADSSDEERYTDFLVPDYDAVSPGQLPGESSASVRAQLAELADNTPEFDVASLRLTPEPVPAVPLAIQDSDSVAQLVANVPLGHSDSLVQALAQQHDEIVADTLVSSLDILDNLMLAEAEIRLTVATAAAAESNNAEAVRNRVAMPVRPERPDRLSIPSRINAIQRVDVPAPPPVRPMRTLSTVLNR